MPYRLCPICKLQGRLLEHTSQDAVVEYFRCDRCGHIWSHQRMDPAAPAVDVAIRPKPSEQP